MYDPFYYNPGMWVWMVLQGAFWLLLAAIAVWAFVRWLNRPSRQAPPQNSQYPPYPPQQAMSALDILRQRYARGEIDAATYEQMRARLEASAGTSSQPGEYREPLASGR